MSTHIESKKEDIAGIAITELGRKMYTDDYEKRVDPRGKIYYCHQRVIV